jgi:hypothetical protein
MKVVMLKDKDIFGVMLTKPAKRCINADCELFLNRN